MIMRGLCSTSRQMDDVRSMSFQTKKQIVNYILGAQNLCIALMENTEQFHIEQIQN